MDPAEAATPPCADEPPDVVARPHRGLGASVDCAPMIAAILGPKHIALYLVILIVIVAIVAMTMRRTRA